MKNDSIKLVGGSKKHRDFAILRDICLELKSGEIQGIIFDDKKEEEWLIKVLCGREPLSSGIVHWQNSNYKGLEAMELLKQKLFLLNMLNHYSPELDVIDFFSISKEALRLNRKKVKAKIMTLLGTFGVDINPQEKICRLTDIKRIELELIRAFERGYFVFILKGITLFLSDPDRLSLMKLIDQMRKAGMAILLVDHGEALVEHCTSNIYEIRYGCTVYVYEVKELQNHLDKRYPEVVKAIPKPAEREMLRIAGVDKLNLSVNSHEIVTVIDQRNVHGEFLASVLKGERKLIKGKLWLGGRNFSPKSFTETILAGVGIIEQWGEQRRTDLFYHLTVLENISLLLAFKGKKRLVKKKMALSIIKEADGFFTEAELYCPVVELQPNLQLRLAYFRWYLFYPKLLVCVNPLADPDIQMRREAEWMIEKCRERGIAILAIASDERTVGSLSGRYISI